MQEQVVAWACAHLFHILSLWCPRTVPYGELKRRHKLILVTHGFKWYENGQQNIVSYFWISLKTMVRRNPFRGQNTVGGILLFLWFGSRNGFQVRNYNDECIVVHGLVTWSWTSMEYISKIGYIEYARVLCVAFLEMGKNVNMLPSHGNSHQSCPQQKRIWTLGWSEWHPLQTPAALSLATLSLLFMVIFTSFFRTKTFGSTHFTKWANSHMIH